MPLKGTRGASRYGIHRHAQGDGITSSRAMAPEAISGREKTRTAMSIKNTASANEYQCTIERNQNGKYNVRVRAVFGRNGWSLPVYFLASTFNRAMKKLDESLQVLQKNEERLRFWGVERTDDPNLTGELLEEYGLWLDRRKDFPRKAAELGVPREQPIPATLLAPVRRVLADAVAGERAVAAIGD
jgi:hypothetical protein